LTVGLTGVIYAIIVVGWAAFLVPLALRRHDQAARNRSIERFSSAMRVLSRRGSDSTRTDGRTVVTPPRTTDRLVTPTLATGVEVEAPVRMPRPTRAAMRAAAARRRRVLVVLVGLTGVVAGVAAFGLVPWWSMLVPVAMTFGFLMLARRQVRRADEAFWQEAATVRHASTNVRTTAARVDASHGAARPDAADGADDGEPTVTLTAEQVARAAAAALQEEIVEVVAMTTADGRELWDPLPVTLPTYVDKPVAQRTYRTIDLGEPGTWSAGHSEADTAVAHPDDGSGAEPDEAGAEARAANA
jgi:hypothetical protein